MSWKLTMNEINEYKAAFTIFDEDQDGIISIEATKKLMRSLGQNLSELELNSITSNAKLAKSKCVEFHEFLDIMANNAKEEDYSDDLKKAFAYFDKNQDGMINFKEFTHTLSTLNEKLNPDQLKELENYCVVKNDSSFEYAELLNLLISKR